MVSKSGLALNVTAPVAPLIVKAPASAPLRLKLTAPPCTSVAAAVYTTVAVEVPSGTLTLVAEVIAGATSVIAIASNKAIYLNAKPVNEGELVTRVTELLENQKEKIILIRADEEVEYSAVMTTMDQLRQAGIEDIGLVVDPKKGAGGAAGGQ